MKDLVLNEILEPDDEEECILTLDNPYKITRCTTSKAIKTISQNKKCKLVFCKHIIDMTAFNHTHMGINASRMSKTES